MGERNRGFYRLPPRLPRRKSSAGIGNMVIYLFGFLLLCIVFIASPPLGLLIFVGLVVVFIQKNRYAARTSSNRNQQQAPQLPDQRTIESSQIEVKARLEEGIQFERHFARLLNKKIFTIEDWTRDNLNKTIGFHVESNQNPDFTIRHNPTQSRFGVECKWRSSSNYSELYKERVFRIAKEEQLLRYRQFSENEGIPVFLVLGAGGKPDKPLEMYCIPLKEITSIDMPVSSLIPFKRSSMTDNFVWENGILK